jgi:hypothetical protein
VEESNEENEEEKEGKNGEETSNKYSINHENGKLRL